MSRLIDADELTAQIMCMAMDKCIVYGNDAIKRSKEIFALAMVAQAPTVDAEPVTRCKDCKHRDPEDKKCDCGHSIRWQLPRSDEWFCADAERRGEGWKK